MFSGLNIRANALKVAHLSLVNSDKDHDHSELTTPHAHQETKRNTYLSIQIRLSYKSHNAPLRGDNVKALYHVAFQILYGSQHQDQGSI